MRRKRGPQASDSLAFRNSPAASLSRAAASPAVRDLPPVETEQSNAEWLHAVGAFVWNDADRILTVASGFREAQGVLECHLRGGSMGRAIPAFSRIRIRFSNQKSYRIGQVVAFLVGTRIMVHRVVYHGHRGCAKNYLITQGDAMLLPDPPVNVRDVLGPVVEFQFDGGWNPPETPPTQPLNRRFLSFVLLTIVGGILEINVRLARWVARMLVAGRWRFVHMWAQLGCG